MGMERCGWAGRSRDGGAMMAESVGRVKGLETEMAGKATNVSPARYRVELAPEASLVARLAA